MRVWARPWSGYATAPSRAARMELVRGDVRQACSGVLTACGPLLTFVARCVQMSSSVAGGLGYVLRPTLAGHRIRPTGVVPSTRRSLAQAEYTATGTCARTPNRQPRHPSGRQRRGMPPEVETGRRRRPAATTTAGQYNIDRQQQAESEHSQFDCPMRLNAKGYEAADPRHSNANPRESSRRRPRATPDCPRAPTCATP